MYRENGEENYTHTEYADEPQRETIFSEGLQSKLSKIIEMVERAISSFRNRTKIIYAQFLVTTSRIVKEIFNIIESVLEYIRGISDIFESLIRGLDRIIIQLNSIRI